MVALFTKKKKEIQNFFINRKDPTYLIQISYNDFFLLEKIPITNFTD